MAGITQKSWGTLFPLRSLQKTKTNENKNSLNGYSDFQKSLFYNKIIITRANNINNDNSDNNNNNNNNNSNNNNSNNNNSNNSKKVNDNNNDSNRK